MSTKFDGYDSKPFSVQCLRFRFQISGIELSAHRLEFPNRSAVPSTNFHALLQKSLQSTRTLISRSHVVISLDSEACCVRTITAVIMILVIAISKTSSNIIVSSKQ